MLLLRLFSDWDHLSLRFKEVGELKTLRSDTRPSGLSGALKTQGQRPLTRLTGGLGAP